MNKHIMFGRGMTMTIAAVTLAFFTSSTGWAQATSAALAAVNQSNMSVPVGTGAAGAGKGFFKSCEGGMNMVFCGMAAMSFASAIESFTTGSGANNTKNAITGCTDPGSIMCSTPSGGPGGGTQPSGGLTGSGTPNSALTDAQNALNSLNSQGYSYNPKTGMVNTPSGSYPAADFANGQTMANAGLIPQSQVAAVNKTIKGILDKYKVDSMAIKGGGGGGSSGAQVQFYDPNAGLFARKNTKPKAQTAGLTRQLSNGELIGAANDDIFAMIHRQYVKENKAGEFIQK